MRTVIGAGAGALTLGTVSTPLVADAAPSISAVGKLVTGTVHPSRAHQALALAPRAAGDLLALTIETRFPSAPSFVAADVTGGGVSTWSRAVSYLTADGAHDQELWWGTVTAPGASTLTVTFTSGAASGTSESASSLDVQEFRSSSGTSTVWAVDGDGKVDTGLASTTPAYPTLTPATEGELYFGYLAVPGAVVGGKTPHVVYQEDAGGNQVVYDRAVSTSLTPAAWSRSQTFSSIGMLVGARPSVWWTGAGIPTAPRLSR